MCVEKDKNGNIKWTFYRKQFRNARYRRWAERSMRYLDKVHPGWHGIIVW